MLYKHKRSTHPTWIANGRPDPRACSSFLDAFRLLSRLHLTPSEKLAVRPSHIRPGGNARS
jgi:hypothetical protein